MFRTPQRPLCLFVVPIVLVVSALAACQRAEHDPLASLRAPRESHRFDLAYWAEQQHQTSSAWIDAWSYCRGRSEVRHPNCRSIRLVGRISEPPPAADSSVLDDLSGERPSRVSRSAPGLSDSSSSHLKNGERP